MFADDGAPQQMNRLSAGVKFMYLPTEMRRVQRRSTMPSWAQVAGSSSPGCPSRLRIAARLIGARHIGQEKMKEPSACRLPPSTAKCTSPAAARGRVGTAVSAAKPTPARRFAPCCVVAFVFESVGSVARCA